MIAPAALPRDHVAAMEAVNSARAHAHDSLLRKTTRMMGVHLAGEQMPCGCCSKRMALWWPVKVPSTTSRTVQLAGPLRLDLERPKAVQPGERKEYTMLITDNSLRVSVAFFIRIKDDAADCLSQNLTDIAPLEVETVLSNMKPANGCF